MTPARIYRPVFAALALATAFGGPCMAKNPPAPQYINVAPLPGSGMALNSEGKPDGRGAMQINIPVAYTPGQDFVELSAYSGQFENSHKMDPEWNNGTGTLAIGIGIWPRLYVSGMAVSSIIFKDSKAVSAQLQIVEESGSTPAVAIGAHDILDKESADFSDTSNTGVGFYGVATRKISLLDRDAHLTLGYGTARFLDRPFAGISVPVSDHVTFATEYDGFQINTALGWRPYGRDSRLTVLGGFNGQAGWLVGAHTTGKMDGLWAIPIALVLLR